MKKILIILIGLLTLLGCTEVSEDGIGINLNNTKFTTTEQEVFVNWVKVKTAEVNEDYTENYSNFNSKILDVEWKTGKKTAYSEMETIYKVEIKKSNNLFVLYEYINRKLQPLKDNASLFSLLNEVKFPEVIVEEDKPDNPVEPDKPESLNRALNKPTETSSNEGSVEGLGSSAVDGDDNSRWSSDRDDSNEIQWIIVDLEDNYFIESVIIDIGGFDNHNQTFEVFVSDDKLQWNMIGKETEKTGKFAYQLYSRVRYIKFESSYSSDDGQVNVYEIKAIEGREGFTEADKKELRRFTEAVQHGYNSEVYTIESEFKSKSEFVLKQTLIEPDGKYPVGHVIINTIKYYTRHYEHNFDGSIFIYYELNLGLIDDIFWETEKMEFEDWLSQNKSSLEDLGLIDVVNDKYTMKVDVILAFDSGEYKKGDRLTYRILKPEKENNYIIHFKVNGEFITIINRGSKLSETLDVIIK